MVPGISRYRLVEDDMGNTNRTTVELLKKYNFPIQKKYGQNFLVDDNILEGILRCAEISKEDTVLEIGPGLGALTGYLCRAAGHVIAVEIDRMLIPVLQETLQEYTSLTLIHNDILKVDIGQLAKEHKSLRPDGRLKVVANLPYYITTPIIMELLEKESQICSITVMVQKEVAQRMQEGPGSKSYGALSLAVQYYSRPYYAMTVSRNCFLPKPDVDSAVIRLDVFEPGQRPVQAKDPEFLFRIIKAAFAQRRKTLVNALSNDPVLAFSKEQVTDALSQLQLPANLRGETLTLQQFALLADALS